MSDIELSFAKLIYDVELVINQDTGDEEVISGNPMLLQSLDIAFIS